jgi:hypothetical protein
VLEALFHNLGDKLERVMLFGHNPEFTFNAKSWSNIDKAKLAKVALDYPKKS